MQQATNLSDALISAEGNTRRPEGEHLRDGAAFIGGSMGCVVGEKITRAIERSHRRSGLR